MDIIPAFAAVLLDHAGVTGHVGDRVLRRPERGVDLPAIVLEPLPGAPRQSTQQGNPVSESRMRVHMVVGDDGTPAKNPDWDTASALAAHIRNALFIAKGQVREGLRIDRVLVEQESGIFEDPETHNARCVWRVSFFTRDA